LRWATSASSVSDYMAGRRTAGLLILKDGEIALERYGMGSGPESHRTGYSTAKSMTSTLVGAALHDGAIGSLDDRCDLYLPRLRGSVWRQRTPARRGPLRPTGSGGRRGVHGRRVLPPSWRDFVGQPDSAPTAFGRLMLGSTAEYGYHWWAVPPLPGGVNNGAFSARGAFGQLILVNPTERVVIAIQSAWRQPQDSDAEVEIVAMIRAAVRALRPDPAS
jgi:CubicO group peptidase (beta-lactamase class C family)